MTEHEPRVETILRQPAQRGASRRLPGSQTTVALQAPIEEDREQTLADLRQAFAGELAQLEEQARQRGLATAREEGAKALAQSQQRLSREWQEKHATLDTSLAQQSRQLADLTRALEQQRDTLLQAMEPMVARLALTVATRLLGQQAESGSLVAALAARAIEEYRLKEPLRIRVSSADHARLRGLLDDEQALATYQLDPAAKVGACLIEHGLGRLDAGLDTQMHALRQALLGDDHVAAG